MGSRPRADFGFGYIFPVYWKTPWEKYCDDEWLEEKCGYYHKAPFTIVCIGDGDSDEVAFLMNDYNYSTDWDGVKVISKLNTPSQKEIDIFKRALASFGIDIRDAMYQEPTWILGASYN